MVVTIQDTVKTLNTLGKMGPLYYRISGFLKGAIFMNFVYLFVI